MCEERIDKILSGSQLATSTEEAVNHNTVRDDDSIQLQLPEAIALNGLLNDLEFMAKGYRSVAEMHFKNWENDTPMPYYTAHDCLVAYGIYINKAQDIDDLVNRWKPNKK